MRLPKRPDVIIRNKSLKQRESVGNFTKKRWATGKMRNPMLGKKHSEETKRKMSEAHKGIKNHNYGKNLSKETKEKISKAKKGNKCNWKGGITPLKQKIWHSQKYQEWRQNVFIRDNFACQKCGDNKGGNLEAHHKKSFSKLLREVKYNLPLLDLYEAAMIYIPLWNIENGLTLCEKCHKKTKNYGNKSTKKR